MAYMRQEYFYQVQALRQQLMMYQLNIHLHEPKYLVKHLDVDAYMYLDLNVDIGLTK